MAGGWQNSARINASQVHKTRGIEGIIDCAAGGGAPEKVSSGNRALKSRRRENARTNTFSKSRNVANSIVRWSTFAAAFARCRQRRTFELQRAASLLKSWFCGRWVYGCLSITRAAKRPFTCSSLVRHLRDTRNRGARGNWTRARRCWWRSFKSMEYFR